MVSSTESSTVDRGVDRSRARLGPAPRHIFVAPLRALALALCVGVAGCELITGSIEYRRVEFSSLYFDSFVLALRDDGVLMVRAQMPDTVLTLDLDERIPVMVSTSSGDVERVGLYHLTCPVGSFFRGFDCHGFSIYLADSYNAELLKARVREIGGREVRLTGSWAVLVREPRLVARQARAADSWPGVEFATLSYWICQCAIRSLLGAPLFLNEGPPRRGDGILQFVSGDTIRARYTNPSGTQLESMLVVP